MGNDKARARGSELLIPRAEWCDVREIQGTDEMVLTHPVMLRAFDRVLELHQPKKRIALLGLCTLTRPYSRGRKWGTLRRIFGGAADLIVTSNGGIIPLEFESCFPYLNYDAHGERKFDALYIDVLHARLLRFFTRHRYDYLLFNYRPNLRNVRAARPAADALKKDGAIVDYAILPTVEQYEKARQAGWRGGSMFPELDPATLNPVLRQLSIWHTVIKGGV